MERTALKQFDDRLVVLAIGWSKQEAHDQAGEIDPIIGSSGKITGVFAAFVAHARDRGRVNDCRLFHVPSLQYDVQTRSHRQDHRADPAYGGCSGCAR